MLRRAETLFISAKQERIALIAFVLSAINVYCIFRIDMRTLLTLPLIISLISGSIAIGYFAVPRAAAGGNTNYRHFVAWCVFPATVHFLLALNYYISFNPQKESYSCRQGRQSVSSRHSGSRSQSNTLLYLENDAYDDYPGIRVFVDREQIKSSRITFTFETGLLGIRVMKDWEFH